MQTIILPYEPTSLAVASGSLLYVGSRMDGVMVINVAHDPYLESMVPSGGPVWDLALTPDGDKLFLAMGYAGLKRWRTKRGTVERVSDRACPEHLALDRQGANLYVSYQCGGPSGRPGHDSAEVFDVNTEKSMGVFSGPPMVGGIPSISSDGKLVLLDGGSACWDSQYDEEGCPTSPNHVFHLIRPSDLRIFKTFAFPLNEGHSAPGGFLDESRFLVVGKNVTVVDSRTFKTVETFDTGADEERPAVFDPNHCRLYVGEIDKRGILVFDAEPPNCSPQLPGLALAYSGDGTLDDVQGFTQLTPHGKLQYRAGRIGQAFYFDGATTLAEQWTGHFSGMLALESTVALYIKIADAGLEETLMDWSTESPKLGIRLGLTNQGRLVFDCWPPNTSLMSANRLASGKWYLVAVTRNDKELVLYIDGEAVARGAPPAQYDDPSMRALIFGGHNNGAPSFRGWLDEIAFYSRALTREEIKAFYQLRESGSCRL